MFFKDFLKISQQFLNYNFSFLAKDTILTFKLPASFLGFFSWVIYV